MTSKPYLLALALFSTISLNLACSKDHESKQTNEPQSKALQLHVTPLAETSIDRSCAELLDTLKDFSANYLAETEVEAGKGFPDGCDHQYHFESLAFQMGYTLKSPKASLKLRIAVSRDLDSSRNLVATKVYIDRVTSDETTKFVPNEADKIFGENLFHLKTTLEAWAAPSNLPVIVFGKTESEYHKKLVSNFGPGSNRDLSDKLGLKIELLPSADDARQGSVKFLNVDPSYFKVRPNTALKTPHFLYCPDIECLNEGITYKVNGDVIALNSKPAQFENGGMGTNLHYIYLSEDDLN
ncbi:MAG: hypothetical protein EOP04_04100 [Proteobacteria bacterium]|nr:MAG: hypothetical protein EOP04_04100 [Pseudomonadota bacterium]